MKGMSSKETKGHNSKDAGGAYGASCGAAKTEPTHKMGSGGKGSNSKDKGGYIGS